MNNKNLFIWDFHGVLEKDNDLAVKAICDEVLKEFGFNKKASINKVRELYGLRWFDYFAILTDSKNDDKTLKMVERARHLSKTVAQKYVKAMDYAEDVLDSIKTKGHHNIVVSNTAQEHLENFLRMVKLNHLINHATGIDAHTKVVDFDTAKEKARVITSYAQKNSFQDKILIGDSEHDIEAGHIVQAKTYLFLTPLNKNKIKNNKAHYTISDLREVLRELGV